MSLYVYNYYQLYEKLAKQNFYIKDILINILMRSMQ